jgi:hypothetical protein
VGIPIYHGLSWASILSYGLVTWIWGYPNFRKPMDTSILWCHIPNVWSPSSFWGVNGVNLSQIPRFQRTGKNRAALLQDARCVEETHGDTDAHHQVPTAPNSRWVQGVLNPMGKGYHELSALANIGVRGETVLSQTSWVLSKKKLTCALQLWLAASCNFLGSRSHRDTKTNEFYSGQSVTECLNSPVTTCRSMQPKIMHRGRFSKIRPNFLFLGSIYLNQ